MNPQIRTNPDLEMIREEFRKYISTALAPDTKGSFRAHWYSGFFYGLYLFYGEYAHDIMEMIRDIEPDPEHAMYRNEDHTA